MSQNSYQRNGSPRRGLLCDLSDWFEAQRALPAGAKKAIEETRLAQSFSKLLVPCIKRALLFLNSFSLLCP
jgi:hypothetical protein